MHIIRYLSIFVIFINFNAYSMGRLTEWAKSAGIRGTAMYHSQRTLQDKMADISSKALGFEELKQKYLNSADQKIDHILNKAYEAKRASLLGCFTANLIHPSRFDPMNCKGNLFNKIINSPLAFHFPYYDNCEKLITKDRLGEYNAQIGPFTSQLIQNCLRKCGINPKNVVLHCQEDLESKDGFVVAEAYTSLINPQYHLLTVNQNFFNDTIPNYIHRRRSNKNITIENMLLMKHIIAHEASHILKRDSTRAFLLAIYHQNEVYQQIMGLLESRADLYSVFHGPTPLAYVRYIAGSKAFPYAHCGTPEWKKLISDLKKCSSE